MVITDTVLCPGCSIRGSPGFAVGAVQHKAWLRLDTESAAAAAPACGDAFGVSASLPAPLKAPGVERTPACAPFASGAPPPACPPKDDLAGLRVQLRFRFLNGTVDNGDGTPPVTAPRELRLSLNVTNTRNKAISLAGVIVPVAFGREVYLDNLNECATATERALAHVFLSCTLAVQRVGGDLIGVGFVCRGGLRSAADRWVSDAVDENWELQCFWAQMVTRAGVPVSGMGNACSYIRLAMTGAALLRGAGSSKKIQFCEYRHHCCRVEPTTPVERGTCTCVVLTRRLRLLSFAQRRALASNSWAARCAAGAAWRGRRARTTRS